MALERGTRLGPYEITGALGAGGMGKVYRARDTRLERAVAIKILSALASGPGEARAVAALQHGAVVVRGPALWRAGWVYKGIAKRGRRI